MFLVESKVYGLNDFPRVSKKHLIQFLIDKP